MNKILISLFFLIIFNFNPSFSADKARGFFISFGVGPRLPISNFASSTDLGYGFNLEFSYTDNNLIPLFLFTKIGYEQYPGSQGFYESTDYSNFSTTNVPLNAGIRYYFSPLLESAFLLIPLIEVSTSFSYLKELHQFKLTADKSNFFNENYKFGFTAGVGVSMFLMEILASFNYFESNQFISADLKIRLPLLVIF
ncbi:MAG: hypothetical protein A2315_13905 [Ignavibacteria bacterium RIFOXYB2_FULL_35_12]|nr:MAG: hypothetical protein A2058_04380 [Ignavibacteria bacterium GWA2_36_19]OGU52494.1 MAG: hypothetical protein A2006_09235 [Ignavibacteria bacterium GWC2_35_8]OGU61310.1 MAG: hypothetical protein A2X60_08755 [Ignavibacteria bacterium GWF2_35_20]OGU80668.1 MAG: hypothetical protein A2W11_10365 [Ignavibacteria bacterium RBG_16_35_7]OGU88479.1 MAG: hypothetical protein A3K31_10725 [Ignavibacteria bacterium RIFOXYA12_FULL_35_25]OGU92436.1 MAG: hypothetical protein A2492_04455 [Ignavibacteria b